MKTLANINRHQLIIATTGLLLTGILIYTFVNLLQTFRTASETSTSTKFTPQINSTQLDRNYDSLIHHQTIPLDIRE